jgi:hypothetical protein
MAEKKKKLRRQVVGSVYKAKEEGQVDYIKMRDSGKFYRLESPKYQLDQLEKAVADGKLSDDLGEKIRDRIAKIPEFVRFELVELVEQKE